MAVGRVALPARGVPDVSGDAAFGGTTAVAPLWAALIALINQQRATPVADLGSPDGATLLKALGARRHSTPEQLAE